MNRLQSYYEQLQLPIKSLFFASTIITIGAIIANPYLNNILKLDNQFLVTLSQLLMTCGGIILTYFPLYVFMKLLTHEKNEPNIIVTGIISYLVFITTMLVLTNSAATESTVVQSFSLEFGKTSFTVYHTGIFGYLSIFLLVRYIYRKTSARKNRSNLYYIDFETTKLITAIVGSALIGAIFTYMWPFILESIDSMMKFIAEDANNPMSMFAYGALERILALANLDAIIYREFWLSATGGTWMNLSGETFFGDVNIWAAQLKEGVMNSGFGRYTSAYYVINMFSIPGYLAAITSIMSNKRARNRNIIVLIIGILVSMLGGVLFPIEILMLATSPTLYLFHLFMTSFTYAVLTGFSVGLGFSFFGNIAAATPGNIIDLIGISQNAMYFNKIIIVILFGVIMFVGYFAFTRFYFSRIAMDVLNVVNKQSRIDDIIEGFGGIENIESISSTMTHIHVELKDRDLLNVSTLHRQGVVRIIESSQGFILSIGTSAFMIQRSINQSISKLEISPVIEEGANNV